MKKIRVLTLLILNLVLLTNCNKDEKKEESKKEIQIEVEEKNKENGRIKFTDEAYKLLENFSQRKKEIIEKLKNSSKEEANEVYKEYFRENDVFFSRNELGYNILAASLFTEEEKKIVGEKGIEIELSEEERKEINTILKEYDIKLSEFDMYFELSPNTYSFYYDIFKNYITDDYKEFLELKIKEDVKPLSNEYGFAISLQEIGDRIIEWENFLKKYPDTDIDKFDPINLLTLRMEYIIGINDVPIEERGQFKTFSIIPTEKQEEFNRFMKKYPDSPTIDVVKYFLENYEEEDIHTLVYRKLMNLE